MRKAVRIGLYSAVGIFALIGVAFTGVFIAMHYGLLNVRGSIADRNQFFINAYQDASSTVLSSTAVPQIHNPLPETPCLAEAAVRCPWNETPEWLVIKAALIKDDAILTRVATETGVEKRMIQAVVFPEQARFFTSNREVFKRWFEPMKLLGSLTQFSLGVSGIKEDTARSIEIYANSPDSPFYPGPGLADLITYEPGDYHGKVRFNRLTDEHDHYYSYLYTALFIKEITMHWQRAGYDVRAQPEVIVTVFNLGFGSSKPNASPTPGGAPVKLGGTTYSYGTLGGLFYRSDELR